MPSHCRQSVEPLFPGTGRPPPIIPNHQRIYADECAKESQILLWTWKVLDEVAVYYYDHYLWDGSVLCRLMNAIRRGSVERVIEPADTLVDKRFNIESFLSAAATYGVEKNKLFHLFDLLLLQNLPRVTACVFELGRLAQHDPDCRISHLGDLPYEPIDPRTKRRSGMPEGDDIHVAHVDIHLLKKLMLLEEYQVHEQSQSDR